MTAFKGAVPRRRFLAASAAGAAVTIVPRHVLGGPTSDQPSPSDSFGGALIGCGGRGGATFKNLGSGVRLLAQCDVKFKDKADNKTFYTDYRKVLERKDIDVVAIATHPGWHALVSIAAMEAGKDVLCEKPMTRFIAEGRAVVEAERRYNRVFQIGTFGRFKANRTTRKIMASGLVTRCDAVVFCRGAWALRYCGQVRYPPEQPPPNVDWDLYCGPAPLRPYQAHRFGFTHRHYWDYEGGALSDFGQHHLDGPQYEYAKDDTSPVEIEAFAPPAHPDSPGPFAWVELKYADGLTLVISCTDWKPAYNRREQKGLSLEKLSPEIQEKIKQLPDPPPLLSFSQAIRKRQPAGGHAEASHRGATLLHLANIAIRTGRKLRYDPVKEQILGDEEANRLVYRPMRAPWSI